jgi:serine/threonine protein phosphatase PrpC
MENFFSEKYIITSDCIFESARKPHKNCQDYAICGDSPFPFLIISDGCGSSDNTDIGSRILTHVAKSNLTLFLTYKGYEDYCKSVIENSFYSIKLLQINETCLDATLIVAYILNNRINVLMCGDGHIFMLDKKGEIILNEKISYKNNAPYYLSYMLNKERDKIYRESQGDDFVTVELTYLHNDKTFCNIVNNKWVVSHTINNIEFIIITSDGIDSFYNLRTAERIPSDEIIKEVIDFKSKNGEFVKRRIRRMLSDFESKDIYNSDDLSVASFMIKENK